jgi:hypothetical protein
MEEKYFNEAIDEILSAIQTKLENAIQDGELLQDIKIIVRGDRTTQKPKTPAVWIFSGIAIPMPGALHTIVERWELDIQIISVAYNTNTEEGYKEANDIVARAKRILLKDRTLGFGHGTFFQDIRSKSFDCSNPTFVNGNFYSAIYTAVVTFCIRE